MRTVLRGALTVGVRRAAGAPVARTAPWTLGGLTRRALASAAEGGAAGGGGGAAASSSGATTEAVVGEAERHTFQAETTQLLNIVTNSLYTDKHVFIRELISNASDALEKVRHRTVAGEPVREGSLPLGITITTDEAANTITITDSGCGMDKGELVDNLGTIARSGSKAFMQRLREKGGVGSTDAASNIIGQFGVGFYSAFMVAEHVTVYSQSAAPDAPGYCWTSRGDGAYEIAPAEGVTRGTRIVIKLKETAREFAVANTVKDIVTKYSNFVNFPITLNGKQVNTVQALWAMPKSDVTEEQYAEFYKYKSGDFEAPLYRLHFAADAPTNIKALLYVGQSHDEKFGMGRMKPGVDLYSRKVLIEAGSGVLPDWLRFLHGVVDSEDIPLNISRESMQDSALMRRLRAVLTRRVLRFFDSEARRDPERYNARFFPEFGSFLKEGAITEASYAQDIAKLLRFESSALPAGTLTSLDEYVSRMPPGQTAVYYLVAPHRALAEASPYMEAFKGRGGKRAAAAAAAAGGDSSASGAGEEAVSVDDVEVLYLYSPMDDFCMNNLREYNGRALTSAETAELDPATLKGVKGGKDKAAAGGAGGKDGADAAAEPAAPASLSDAQVTELGSWMVSALPKRLSKVRGTSRLSSSPAVVTDHESASLRRMMRMVEQTAGKEAEALKLEAHMMPKQTLEVNPAHPIITRLYALKDANKGLAVAVAEQIVDNALVAAGLLDDPRTMLPRLNALLENLLLAQATAAAGSGPVPPTDEELKASRFVPPKEAEEREVLAMGEEMVAEMLKAGKGKAQAGAGGEGSGRE